MFQDDYISLHHGTSNRSFPIGMATAQRPPLFAGIKGDFWGASLEFIGTFFFLTLAYGGVQAATATNTPDSSIGYILYASLCFGFSLLVSAWLFFRVTGGLFNPNVSFALLLAGVIGPVRFVLYSIAQLVGSIAAAAVVLALTPGPCSFKYVSVNFCWSAHR